MEGMPQAHSPPGTYIFLTDYWISHQRNHFKLWRWHQNMVQLREMQRTLPHLKIIPVLYTGCFVNHIVPIYRDMQRVAQEEGIQLLVFDGYRMSNVWRESTMDRLHGLYGPYPSLVTHVGQRLLAALHAYVQQQP